MKKLLILLLFSYSIANAQLPTWVYGNQVNIGGRDTSVSAGLKLFINGRTTGKYLKNSGWGVSSFGNIESADVPWGGGFTLYDVRYVRDQRFLDSIAAVRAAFNSINLDWNNITGKPALLIAGNNLADVSNVATARTNLNVYSKTEADARYLQSFTESDPVWTAAAANYYTKTQADARYLQSFTETDPTVYAWAKAATKPSYAVAEITGLQTALDGKEPVLGFTPVPNTRTINGYALSANISLNKTDVGLGNVPNTDATNPANISQSASYRFVTDSEKSTWNAKQNALGFTPENIANKGQANGYADLDANGKVPASRIDFSQTGQTFVVASQSAMLAVSGANVGAMAIRTDQSRTYVLIATPASTLANWVQLLSPDAPVQSVNGQTGNVNLLTTNIGEGTNLYYTDARARAALSAGTGISYNNTTGQISSTITQYTDALARASLSFAAGSGGYNSTTGVITIPTNTSQLTNGAGFITGINSTMVTTALGYTPPQPNGTGASGTWAINISGNASSASNSTQWNGMTYSGSVITSGTPLYVMAWDGSQWRPANPGPVQSFLGLGSNAYTSTAFLPLSGGTLTGNLVINAGNQALRVNGGSYGNSGGNYHTHGYNVGFTSTGDVWTYLASDFASFIRYQSGGFQFYTAPSGTGGATMSPSLRYTLDVNGNNTWTGNGTFGGSATATQFNGSGAGLTGTASSLSIGGNAATATNATQWNGYTNNIGGGPYDGAPDHIAGFSSTTLQRYTQTAIRSFLGLGSYAYRSSGLAELSGATFTGALNGTSAEFSTGIGTEGMGRFKGWYVSGTGAAAEVGTFGGSAYLFAYDRTASSYIPAQIRGSEIKLNISGIDALTIAAGRDATFSSSVHTGSRLSIAALDQSYASLFIGGDITTGPSQYALLSDAILSGTSNSVSIYANARIKGSTAVTNAYGVFILNSEKLSGASIANNYGLYIQNQTSGSSSNYAIYSAGGINYFGGNVGIGTTSPNFKLEVNQGGSTTPSFNVASSSRASIGLGLNSGLTTGFIIGRDINNNGTNDFYITNAATGVANFQISSTGAATFSSSVTATQFNGSGVGLTSVPWGSITGAPSFLTTAVTSATGTANQITVSASTGAVTFSLPSAVTISGNMTAAGFFESSDIRLKDVFQTYTSADEINTIQYTFKGEFKVKYGYSAQQVQKIIPSAVEVGSDGFYKVDYTSVHSYKIMMLEKRIAELERRVNNALPEQVIKIIF